MIVHRLSTSIHIPEGVSEQLAREEAAAALTRSARRVQELARANVTAGLRHPGDSSGDLAASIEVYPEQADPQELRLQVASDERYSLMHEEGGVIVPLAAQSLHFMIDGRNVFAKSVTEPAQPYMEPAMVMGESYFLEEIAAAGMEGVAGGL